MGTSAKAGSRGAPGSAGDGGDAGTPGQGGSNDDGGQAGSGSSGDKGDDGESGNPGAKGQGSGPNVAGGQVVATALKISGKVGGATDSKSYSAQLSAAGGKGGFTWKAFGLPSGLTLSGSSGKISGTPSQSGKFSVMVLVSDSSKPPRLGGAVYQLGVATKPKG